MTEKRKDALLRAKAEVLNLLDVMDTEKPEVVGNLIDEKLGRSRRRCLVRRASALPCPL